MIRTLAILMAGGAGERLRPLTNERAKPAVPFGGKYRLIDFTLSNCVNSGLRRIFVLTQYKSTSLNRHIQEGWNISSSGLGDYIYPMPAQQKVGSDWYRGTADAVRQNLDLIKGKGIEDIIILSGDHVCKMDYSQLLAFHRQTRASLTIAAINVPKSDAAGRLGVLEVDGSGKLAGFEEKPGQPKTRPDNPDQVFASMGIYAFKARTLIEALQGAEEDFGKEVIPSMLARGHRISVYDYQSRNTILDEVIEVSDKRVRQMTVKRTPDSEYWRDVGTLDAYYEANMDLTGERPTFNLYSARWPLRTFQRPLPPVKYISSGCARESLVCDGCIIKGSVSSSILSPGVTVEKGAVVERSVLMDGVFVGSGSHVRNAIIDKHTIIYPRCRVGVEPESDRKRGATVTESGVAVLPKGCHVSASSSSLV